MKRLGLAGLLAAALACSACASLPQRSQWTPAQPPVNGVDGDWAQAGESILDGLRIKTLNNRSDLYLALSTDKRALQSQLAGRYGQELRFWFGTPPQGHGIRISFTAKPQDSEHEDPLVEVDRSVTLEGPGSEKFPRPWAEGSEGLEVDARTVYGTMTYVLKLPLQPQEAGAFALGVGPGGTMTLSISASPLPELDDEGGAEPASAETPGTAPLAGGLSGGRHGRHSRGGGRRGADPIRPTEAYGQQLKLTLAKAPPGI